MTIDVQLEAHRGRCPFRMYIASKPQKYGIKVFMVNDAEFKYCMNAFPYLGRGSADPEDDQNQGHYYVKQLLTNLMQHGRTVCHDNWFTSLNITTDLLDAGIHSVGPYGQSPTYCPNKS